MINPLSLRITAAETIEINNNDANCLILDIRSRVRKQQSNWKICNAISLEANAEEINSWAESIAKNSWVFFYCA
ncbi:MAG: hypothetical protein EXS07_12485 [Gemmataceae bacterium]|nr:hypothetical protein [Gemmataceae bacterium]